MDVEERRFKALDFLLDYSKGTIWWVKDRLWEQVVPGFVRKREGHPGLSICRRRAEGLFSVIPLLLGTTRPPRECFVVEGVTESPAGEPPRRSCFSLLRPFPLRFGEFGDADGISMNAYKPRLTPGEESRLDGFLRKKGL